MLFRSLVVGVPPLLGDELEQAAQLNHLQLVLFLAIHVLEEYTVWTPMQNETFFSGTYFTIFRNQAQVGSSCDSNVQFRFVFSHDASSSSFVCS